MDQLDGTTQLLDLEKEVIGLKANIECTSNDEELQALIDSYINCLLNYIMVAREESDVTRLNEGIRLLKQLLPKIHKKQQAYPLGYLAYLEGKEDKWVHHLVEYIRNLQGQEEFSSDEVEFTFYRVFLPSPDAFWSRLLPAIEATWPDSAASYIFRGHMELEEKKDPAEAIDAFAIALSKDETSWMAALGCADGYYSEKNWNAAVKFYRKALQSSTVKEMPYVYFRLAWSLGKLKRYEEEEEAYRKCIELDPEYPYAKNNLGLAVMRQGRYEEAVELFNRSLASGTDGKYPLRNKADALEKLGRFDEAITVLEKDIWGGRLTKSAQKKIKDLQRKASQNSRSRTPEHREPVTGGKRYSGLPEAVSSDYSGTIKVASGTSPYRPFPHQLDALNSLDACLRSNGHFEGLLVIPTGGGKTLTAVQWLLRNVIDKGEKVLWIAHRHELLNQAYWTVRKNSYANLLPNRKSFRYRIISGQHDRPVNIREDDDFIIASKDSLYRGMDYLLDHWVDGKLDEVLLVIDEAHHATAKTYRKVVESLRDNVTTFNMLGLTATPFRTSPDEAGLLKKVFRDDIIYKIDLQTSISRGILSDPVFEEMETELVINQELTASDIRMIERLDNLPHDIGEQLALSKERNNRIVNHYLENQDKYGKLLVFAIDINHAIALNALFRKNKIASEYVVSSIRDAVTGVRISQKENQEKIERFRNGEVQVLVNVDILTEGTDLPDVQTVFLTRPTTSSILMTQMIGRALRGVNAGGTERAFIVSFIDDWKNKIAWVNPEKLYIEETADFRDDSAETSKKLMRLIAIEKLEEFARILDESIDTTSLESLDFLERIPVGLYSFSLIAPDDAGNSSEKHCEVLVYDNMQQPYQQFLSALEDLFEMEGLVDKEILEPGELDHLCQLVETNYFSGYDMTIPYRREDIVDILQYYALKGVAPTFLVLKDRENYDLSALAREIYDRDMGRVEEAKYINSVWSKEGSFWKVLFGHRQQYFVRQLNIEIEKLQFPDNFRKEGVNTPQVVQDMVSLEKLTLQEIREKNPQYWRSLVNEVFENSRDENGYYTCASSGFKSKHRIAFQIDHIIPMSNGGLTRLDNLQLLTRRENARKGDQIAPVFSREN